jgi:transcriptional regulator with XRE-family HTH domain
MDQVETQIRRICEHGLQAKIARRTRITRTTVTSIFSGRRRATPQQAKLLSEEFERRQIAIGLWDLLFEVAPGESLVEFIRRRG